MKLRDSQAPRPSLTARPGSNPAPKCVGEGLHVLLIRSEARQHGSVGKRLDWEWDALKLAPSRHWHSCRPPTSGSFTRFIRQSTGGGWAGLRAPLPGG